MQNFTQKYTIICLLEEIPEGYEFSSNTGPLHVTLADTFSIEWSVDMLIKEAKVFQKMCQSDIERAEKVISAGQQLVGIRGAYPREVVQPKCEELLRVCDIITDRLTKRVEILAKNRDLMERVEKVKPLNIL